MSISTDYKNAYHKQNPATATSSEELEISSISSNPGIKFSGSGLSQLLPKELFEGTAAKPGTLLSFLENREIIFLSCTCKGWYEGALSAARQAAVTRIILQPYPLELQLALRTAGTPIEDLPLVSLKDRPEDPDNDSFWWNPIATSSIQAADMSHAVMRFSSPQNPLHNGLVFYSRARGPAALFPRRDGLHAFLSYKTAPNSRLKHYLTYNYYSERRRPTFPNTKAFDPPLNDDENLLRLVRGEDESQVLAVPSPAVQPIRSSCQKTRIFVVASIAVALLAALAAYMLRPESQD